ncbi:MAG TPA: FkbM family methyltransferase [Arsenicitalea sp.]|jgi:FkbM family methyltransferase|nr:FkbM family methyltransferase [Arsenicitalea sp.]
MTLGRTSFGRLKSGFDKLRWGIRVVGPGSAARGAVSVMALQMRRPKRSEIQLRSGPILEFNYPSQFPPTLVLFGDLIDPEFAFLRQVARPGWVFADVGAAIGQFSLFAATLPGAVVHAFEPSSANVVTLQGNLNRNAVTDRVTVHQLALSNTSGEASFETMERTWMSRLSEADSTGERVCVQTLADAFARLGLEHVAVLKINVAGFEPKVLEGAEPYLAEGKADILILLLGLESLPWYGRIAALGYRFFYYHPEEQMLYEVTAFDPHAVLDHRPWPARHIIGIRAGVISSGLLTTLAMCRL